MIAIHTKYLNPTNSRGARIKAYTAPRVLDRRGFEATISYPHEESGHMCHFRAVEELVRKNGLDWDLSEMRWGDSADGRGYSFCFNVSKHVVLTKDLTVDEKVALADRLNLNGRIVVIDAIIAAYKEKNK